MSTSQQMSNWRFSPSVAVHRTEALLQAPPFNEILEAVASGMEVLCCHRRDCDDLQGFSRVIFNLQVPRETFDLFFNSKHGYRGAYFESPHTGLQANHAFIQRLLPLLLAWAEKHEPSFDRSFAKESLTSPTAKVWLNEVETHLCDKCIGEWGNPVDENAEILNERWEFAPSPNGLRGRRAPPLTKIRVFGAFLNERHDEFTPSRKRHRAIDLNECGWS